MSGVAASGRLQSIVGLRLSIVRRAADMLGLHFGTVRASVSPLGRTGTTADFTFHVQAPWRFDRAGRIVTGRSELWTFAGSGAEPDGWSYETGNSLQDVRLTELFGPRIERLGWCPGHQGPLVIAVAVGETGDVAITFDAGLAFRIFVDQADGEAWRFFAPGNDDHLVFPEEAP